MKYITATIVMFCMLVIIWGMFSIDATGGTPQVCYTPGGIVITCP